MIQNNKLKLSNVYWGSDRNKILVEPGFLDIADSKIRTSDLGQA